MEAMTGLISHRLSKTATKSPVRGYIRGIPMYIGAEESSAEDKFFGASGIAGTGIFANIPDAIRMTGGDIESLQRQLFTAAYPGSLDAQNFYLTVMIPFADDWNAFQYKHNHGFSWLADNFIFSGLSTWHSNSAVAQGFLNKSAPKPAGPNVDIIQQGANKAVGGLEAIWSVLKWILIVGGIAISIGLMLYLGGH
jgi:hypothetical protein